VSSSLTVATQSINTMNYTIVGNGTQASAFRNGMGLPELDGNSGTVIQKVIDLLCPPNCEDYEAGGVITLIGFFNMWASPLVIRNWAKNNGRSKSTLCFQGAGNTTLLFNGLPSGTHAINIIDGACVDFRNMEIVYVQADGGSAIRVNKDKAEVGSWKGIFHDMMIRGASTTNYTFYAENFFNFDFQRVVVECNADSAGSMWLYNNSTNTNYGNSKFQNLSLLAPNRNDGAALKISSVDVSHPMNLNSFDVLNIGTNFYGPGQAMGRGIWLNGAAYTTFNHIDVEYMPTSLYLEAARRITFLSGYIHPDGLKGLGIYCSNQTNACQFNLEIDSDCVDSVMVNDLGSFKEPNNYDISLSGCSQESKIIIEQKSNSLVTTRANGSGRQSSFFSMLSAKRFNVPSGNDNPQNNDLWVENNELKIKLNGVIKTLKM
jgi:hypothetical protein